MKNKLTAEFFGTFWLVFGGCGSAVLAASKGVSILIIVPTPFSVDQ